MNKRFESNKEVSDEEITLSEMLAVMRSDHNNYEIIDMDSSTDLLLASVGHNASAITWDLVKRFTKNDETSHSLTKWIMAGCPGPVSALPENVKLLWRVRDQLRVHDGVPMMTDRIIRVHSKLT